MQYYDYWSARTAKRTPSGKPDPSLGVVLNDINEDTVRANEDLLRHYQAEAAKGNREAQAWLEKYGIRIKGARVAQDVVTEGIRREEQREASPDRGQVTRNAPSADEPPSPPIAVISNLEPDRQVNLRATAAASSQSLLKLDPGQKVLIVGHSVLNGETEWTPVRIGNYKGWITKKFLKVISK